MTYLVSTMSLEEILKNPETIPSPIIIQKCTRKPVMLSILPNDVHFLYMGYNKPIYIYIMKDNWFKKHLPNMNITYDAGVLNDFPMLMEDYETNKTQIQEIYPIERFNALPLKTLHKMLQDFGKAHSFNDSDYYGCVLKDCKIHS